MLSGKVDEFGQGGCIGTKVVVLGQRWVYSGKSSCNRENWLYSVKSCCFCAKVVVLGQGGCILEK